MCSDAHSHTDFASELRKSRQSSINCIIFDKITSGGKWKAGLLFPQLHLTDFLHITELICLHMTKTYPNDIMSPHDRIFSTGTACGACDKYEVCSGQCCACVQRLLFHFAKKWQRGEGGASSGDFAGNFKKQWFEYRNIIRLVAHFIPEISPKIQKNMNFRNPETWIMRYFFRYILRYIFTQPHPAF